MDTAVHRFRVNVTCFYVFILFTDLLFKDTGCRSESTA
jgi:hypothetical protein